MLALAETQRFEGFASQVFISSGGVLSFELQCEPAKMAVNKIEDSLSDLKNDLSNMGGKLENQFSNLSCQVKNLADSLKPGSPPAETQRCRSTNSARPSKPPERSCANNPMVFRSEGVAGSAYLQVALASVQSQMPLFITAVATNDRLLYTLTSLTLNTQFSK